MLGKNYRDIVAGLLFVFFGLFVLIHSVTSLRLGTPASIGPGMFPAGVGVILAGLGVGICVPALFQTRRAVSFDFRSFAAILLSIFAFGLMVDSFGLVPAIVALTIIASLADAKLSWREVAILASALSIGATMIFQVGLRLPISTVNWPW